MLMGGMSTMTIKSFEKVANPRDIRRRLGMNQQEFWGMIGVTQSGGAHVQRGRALRQPG